MRLSMRADVGGGNVCKRVLRNLFITMLIIIITVFLQSYLAS